MPKKNPNALGSGGWSFSALGTSRLLLPILIHGWSSTPLPPPDQLLLLLLSSYIFLAPCLNTIPNSGKTCVHLIILLLWYRPPISIHWLRPPISLHWLRFCLSYLYTFSRLLSAHEPIPYFNTLPNYSLSYYIGGGLFSGSNVYSLS